MTDILLFNLFRRKKREWAREGMAALTQAEVDEINAVLADWKAANRFAGAAGGPPASDAPVSGAGQPEATDGALRPSQAAYSIIKEFEGYHRDLGDGRVQAYPDPASGGEPWTIGYGSTGPDVRPGTIWTKEQAAARLESDVAKFAAGVARRIGDAATARHEFDAMVSLAYNVGLGNFESSTLLRKHKAGDKAGAAAEFARWNKAAGKVMAGLTRRRAAEAELYRGNG